MAASTRFARVLESLQQSGETRDVFVAVREFRHVTADLTQRAAERNDSDAAAQVKDWEEETTLWDLINALYEFRFRLAIGDLQPYPEFPYLALRIKQENYMLSHPELKELEIVIHWLQTTIGAIDDSNADADTSVLKGEKWQATAAEVGNKLNFNFIDHLDVDAPIRSNKLIHPADEQRDSDVFRQVYRLVLAGKYREASEVANDTGNFALALILVGAINEYQDPEIDQVEGVEDVPKLALGVKDKLTWKRTTYQLSQLPGLNRYERMIYSALVGGDISDNIDEAQGSWEETLLLYCQQLLAYRLEQFWIEATGATVEPCTPPPQFANIYQIIQTLTHMLSQLQQACGDTHRVLYAAVIQGRELDLFADTASQPARVPMAYIRIVTHMAIVYQLLFADDDADAASIHQITTNLIDVYTTRLHWEGLNDLVVIYFSFITDETQRRELLLRFLSQVAPSDRQPLLRKWQDILADMSLHPGEQEMAQTENVIHHMAQSALAETKAYYQPEGQILLDDQAYDDEDNRLISAVDSYYVNGMYYHFINASLHVIRRFLTVGKLAAFAAFAESTDKNLNRILKEYDRQTIGDSDNDVLDQAQREEFEQYIQLAEGLRLIQEFDDFAAKRAWNSTQANGNGDPVEHSIEKVTLTLTHIIQTWFRPGIVTGASDEYVEMFKSFRFTLVPYLIRRLLEIYVVAREKDWSYMARAFDLIDSVADDSNDYLECFTQCHGLPDFMAEVSQVATIALERGVTGLFPARA